MLSIQKTETLTGEFFTIYLESLRIDIVLDFDLYIKTGRDIVLYRACSLPFTEATRSALLENNVDRLYVPTYEQHAYQGYIEANIDEVLDDAAISETVKAGIVYDSSTLLVKDIFNNPALGDNIKRSQAMVESTVSFVLKGQNAFHNLLDVMSFNYSTYTHSVNVCTFSLALAQFTGINDTEALNQLGTGALLHDVGKTKIPESVLMKRGSLTESEMEQIRMHPQWGFEIIKRTDLISKASYYPVIQHHEREDRSGYPDGLSASGIHPYSKIVAIADVFDAITTERVYRRAVDTFPALMTMYAERSTFDQQLLEQFTKLMGPTNLTG